MRLPILLRSLGLFFILLPDLSQAATLHLDASVVGGSNVTPKQFYREVFSTTE